MLFSVVAVNLNRAGFRFTTDQLFWLTALPALSGATLRIFYSFMVPIFGGRRWTALSTATLAIPTLWLGLAVQDPATNANARRESFIVVMVGAHSLRRRNGSRRDCLAGDTGPAKSRPFQPASTCRADNPRSPLPATCPGRLPVVGLPAGTGG